MATLVIDGQQYEVAEGRNLLETCLELGIDLPYFCWHPAMGSVGSCRQCAVQVYANDDDQQGRMVMACMTPVTSGLRASTTLESVRQFRETSIEVLMANHPHDCPVCEEGGECHLQDMTVMSGHHERTYRGTKKTYVNQDLGPCIGHEMNRCITCYRCVRFYNDYAGGSDLQAMASRENTYFGRYTDGTLESPFSGNLVEVCPTGVFTDKPFSQSFTRKWDLQSAPSICTLCSLGCNINPNERYGTIKRIVNRYHEDINGYFLCDRGRFGFGHFNPAQRPDVYAIKTPEKGLVEIPKTQAWEQLADLLKRTPMDALWGIGSTRASVEENQLLQLLVGEDRYFAGTSDQQLGLLRQVVSLYQSPAVSTASLKQIEQSDAVLIIGEDLTHTAPMMALAVRQASRHRSFELAEGARIPRWQDAAVRNIGQDERSPIMQLQSYATPLDEIASHTHIDDPLGLVAQIDAMTKAVSAGRRNKTSKKWAVQVANQLMDAAQPCVIAGTSAGAPALLAATDRLVNALSAKRKQAIKTALVTGEPNSIGLALSQPKNGVASFVKQLLSLKTPQTVICLQSDLYEWAQSDLLDSLWRMGHRLVVIDYLENATATRADLFLPATTVVETEGTLVNNEGRAQRFFSVYAPKGTVQDTWRLLVQLLDLRLPSGVDPGVDHFDAMVSYCIKENPALSYLTQVAPNASFQKAGLHAPRQPHRYSGRTSMNAGVNVHEPRQTQEFDSGLAYSMEGIPLAVDTPLNTNNWSPGWNSNEAINKFQQEIDGPLKQGMLGVLLFENETLDLAMPPLTPSDEAGITAQSLTGNQLLAVRQARIFGSDSRANQSPSLYNRIGQAIAQIHPDTAAARGLTEQVRIRVDGQDVIVPIMISTQVAKNTIAVPDVPWVSSRIQIARLPCIAEVEVAHA